MIQKGSTRAARDELEAAAEEVRARAAPQTRNVLLSRIETLRATALMLDGQHRGSRFGARSRAFAGPGQPSGRAPGAET